MHPPGSIVLTLKQRPAPLDWTAKGLKHVHIYILDKKQEGKKGDNFANCIDFFFWPYNKDTMSLTHPGDGQGLVEVLSSCQTKPPGGWAIQDDIQWHVPLKSPAVR